MYSPPAGTTATSGTTIESAKYNAFVADITSDLNAARPVSVGGTGVSTVAAAQTAFKIPPFDGAANISGPWEWQDDVGAVFGNDADASIEWVSANNALTMSVGGNPIVEVTSAGADVTGDLTVSNDVTVTGETETGTFGTTAISQIDLRAKLTLDTKQATTSGTSFDFSVPSGAKEITVMLNEVSLNGTDHILVQIGDSGGIENTGYSSSSFRDTASTGSTSAFVIIRASSGTTHSGMMVLRLMDASTFTWVSSHSVGTGGGAFAVGGGAKALSAELTTVRVTRSGTDTFDNGSINISYR